MGRLPGGCGEDVCRVWGGCLEGVRECLAGVQGCLKDMRRLPGGYGEVALRVWEVCLEGVGRLLGVCGEVVWRG